MEKETKYNFIFAEINNKNLVIDFLNSLDKKERAKVIANIYKLIDLLSANPFPNPKISKYLRDGVFELKINLPNKTSRLLYFFIKNNTIVFTNGFIKKVEKTPLDELNIAIKIKNLYKEING